MHSINRTWILYVAVAVFLFEPLNIKEVRQDELINIPELSMPITDKKLVIAHCMTNIIRYKGHKMEDSCNPEYYSSTGNITAPLGGLTQVYVLSDKYLSNKTLDEAVEFEMRAAIKSGIDGFQFYYTLRNNSWDEIIKAYFRVSAIKKLDFKFTFCISHPSGGTEESRIADFGRRIKSIMDEVGKENPHWLRTPDGRLVVYTWYGDGLADVPEDLNGRSAPYYIARAYQKLADMVNERFAMIISINELITDNKLDSYLDYFPAVWLWTLPYADPYIGEKVSAICKNRGRIFTGSAFPDFYTSKLLKKGTWDMYHSAADAVKAGMEQTERKYIVTGLSYNFRKQLEFAIDKDVPLINIITWNDYPEGHHLAPELNHNDGFSILLQHYKCKWKAESSPLNSEDVVVAFYKKYRHSIEPSQFSYPVIEIEKAGVPVEFEDSMEVITILKDKGKLFYNNQVKDVASGMQATKFAASEGQVTISLQRNGKEIEKLICPQPITDKPLRTDRLTYSFSNQTLKTYKDIFGSAFPSVMQAYDATAQGKAVHFQVENK